MRYIYNCFIFPFGKLLKLRRTAKSVLDIGDDIIGPFNHPLIAIINCKFSRDRFDAVGVNSVGRTFLLWVTFTAGKVCQNHRAVYVVKIF